MDFRYQRHYEALRGIHGTSRDIHGSNAEDVTLKVPLGTTGTEERQVKLLVDVGLIGSDGQDLVPVALQYALAQSPSACVIPGFKDIRQVESNAVAPPLSVQDVAFMWQTLQG